MRIVNGCWLKVESFPKMEKSRTRWNASLPRNNSNSHGRDGFHSVPYVAFPKTETRNKRRVPQNIRVERVVVTRIDPLKAMQVVDFPDFAKSKGATDVTDFTDSWEERDKGHNDIMTTPRRIS